MSAPPPLPPDAYNAAGTPHPSASPPFAPPPKRGMSGCAIAAIIGAVAMVLGVFVIGILAAIAMPAYNDYTVRAKLAVPESYARSLLDSVDRLHEDSGECPDNAALGDVGSAITNNPNLESLEAGALDNGHCAIELRFKDINPAVDGKTLLFESAEDGWNCYGGTLESRYRSPRCRNTISP